MEMKMLGWCVLSVFLVLIAAASGLDNITCSDAVKALLPCQPFLVGFGQATPPATCCEAALNVLKQATTTETCQALCVCFKKAGKELGVKPEIAKQIPDLCKIQSPVPIDPTVDCTKIQ